MSIIDLRGKTGRRKGSDWIRLADYIGPWEKWGITDQERPPGPRNQETGVKFTGTRLGKGSRSPGKEGEGWIGAGWEVLNEASVLSLRTRQTYQAFGFTAAPHWQRVLTGSGSSLAEGPHWQRILTISISSLAAGLLRSSSTWQLTTWVSVGVYDSLCSLPLSVWVSEACSLENTSSQKPVNVLCKKYQH